MVLDDKLEDHQSYYSLFSGNLEYLLLLFFNFTTIHPVVVKIFDSEPKKSNSQWRHRKSQGTTKVIRIPPLGPMDVCTKFHDGPVVVEMFQSGLKLDALN